MSQQQLWLLFLFSFPTLFSILLFLLSPEILSLHFNLGVRSTFHNLDLSEVMHCIIAAFMKVFISYLKCFHVHSLCFDLQKEKESSFTGGKTATCEN